MTCPACDDLGILPVDYIGEPRHFALCLCEVGEDWRRASNHGKPTNPAWHILAARNNVPLDRIVKLEDYATPAELAAFGFTETSADTAMSAIAAAARSRKVGR